MEIILKQDIPSLGYKNEVVKVRDGYGRNYLIPQGLAILATESAKKVMAENLKQRGHKEAKIKQEALGLKENMKDVKITIGAKTSTTGKIFGSVNNIQISEALQKAGYQIERKNILVKGDSIKEIGSYVAKIKLHKEVEFDLPFEVVSE
ncbi:MAG TPA: 50S ribosomal protein L9 [Marinilabiliales bacterium]|jgi:large subunit ribosomal protein L9|nr:MAG: 50S ribosomal protein L9 [Bacteroidetes bacterium GWA2_40_14]OFX62744.1 MAG: 50S ribosomal protein L9 [Bacteroidetes bacterium GWC2_40_13]OFX71984.1 MAG: 50S ribosomal protein L9 [Bacteroidetes bacterium GWD2_40_43]OFX89590.1 MAG: 50S ribosomal protein L9 [Bacteroidetes bacterium GWE2_40_63]OFY24109.1 MAG: 50S ribosomal protein L9 [Bacteroidetes bacterium GWF2_40_13]OFZ26300.1 MAG: 50S ribosomal protein L9 [Bacteroidetes bacterium RIFOXYC2_FULL_40_12]HAM99519.1 50S ribosomal protein L